jgi:3alpha(or 20beta)-hydroxysteroid dehydrogenase
MRETTTPGRPIRYRLVALSRLPQHAEQMAKTSGGSIVNISSIVGFVGSTSGHPACRASKGAVRIYVQSRGRAIWPIRCPGQHCAPRLCAADANAGERADKIAATPLRRIGKPMAVAYGVPLLASDEASSITDTELVIDGGFLAR